MATIKQIAKLAGVSIGTVDRVLHERGGLDPNTKARVQAAIKELGYVPNQTAQSLAVYKKRLHILCIIIESPVAPFFHVVNKAIRRKADSLNQAGVRVTLVNIMDLLGAVSVDGGQRSETAVGLMQDQFLQLLGDVNAVVYPNVAYSLGEWGTEIFKQRNLPWICYNSGSEDEGMLAFVGADYEKSGRIAMGLTALLAGIHANVLVLSIGIDCTESYMKRMQGYCREGKQKYPGIRIADILEIPIESEKQEEILKNTFEAHPEIDMVYIINPADYAICDRIRNLERSGCVRNNIPVITYDLTEESTERLKNGSITAVVTQQPEKQGELALDLMYKYLVFGEIPEKVYYTKQEIYIEQNV